MAQQNYLSQLTPEMIQAIRNQGDGFFQQNGMYFAPRLETTYNGQDGETTQQTGYYGGYLDPTDYTLNHLRPYGIYDKSGKLTGTGAWSQTDESDLEFFAPALLAAAAGIGASFLAPGAAAAGAGGDLVNGAFLGEGMASGIPAWDLAATNAGLSLATPAGAIMQNSPMSLIPESAMPGTVTGYAGPTFGGAAAASLIPGVSNNVLGGAATLLGAAAGSQGTPGQTSERKMDPRLDNYVFGQNGVVPMAAGLLSQQMPMAQQGGQQAFEFGRGLLGRGVAANPFMR